MAENALTPGAAIWNYIKRSVPPQLDAAGHLAQSVAQPFTNLFGNGGQEFWNGPQDPQAAHDMRNALMTLQGIGSPAGAGAAAAQSAEDIAYMKWLADAKAASLKAYQEGYPSLEAAQNASLNSLPAPPPGAPIRAKVYRGASEPEQWPPHPSQDVPESGMFWASSKPSVARNYTGIVGGDVPGDIPFAEDNMAPHMIPGEVRFSNPLVVDANGSEYGSVPFQGGEFSTDDIVKHAARSGVYDGVAFHNIYDDGPLAHTYAALKPGTVFSPLTGEQLYSGGAPLNALIGSLRDRNQR